VLWWPNRSSERGKISLHGILGVTEQTFLMYYVLWNNISRDKVDTKWMFRPYTSVEIKCQLDATEFFIADLIACSTCFGHHYAHHQELKSIIQWLLPVVFRAVVFQVAGLVWS